MKDGHHRIVVYHHAQMIALETVNVPIKYAIVIMDLLALIVLVKLVISNVSMEDVLINNVFVLMDIPEKNVT